MTRVICVALVAALASGCASMQTKEHRAQEAAHLGLISHPELGQIQQSIAILSEKFDTLFARIATVEEAHRDDTEMVIEYVRKWVEEMKVELAKVKQ